MSGATHQPPLATAGFAHPPRNVAAFGLKTGDVVVDFGAGSGAYVMEIAKVLGGTGRVYAVDVQRDLLRRIHNEATRSGFKNVDVVWADCERENGSKIVSSHADLVLASNIMFQLDNKEGMIAEAWRILKNNGTLVIIDWSDSFGGMGPVPKAVVKKEFAREHAQKAGFTLDREFDAGAHHYGLVFRKRT